MTGDAEPLAPVFRALADPTRRKALDLLRQGPMTTGELCKAFPQLTRFAVMKHLGLLEQAGLLVVRRRGRQRLNHLNAVPLQQIEERWLGPFRASWAAGLLRLKASAECERPVPLSSLAQGETTMPVSTISNNAFNIELEVGIDAPPAKVFEALTLDLPAWWGAPYLCDQERAQGICLEPQLGGRLFETWGEKDGALWGLVTRLKKDAHLRIEGNMGLQDPVVAVVDVKLESREPNKTLIKLSHKAVGDISEASAQSYHGGWQDLIGTRLKAFVERGERSGLGD